MPSQSLPLEVVGFVIAAMFLSAMATYELGLFAIFGSFVMVFFLPIFFTCTGLRTDIGALQGSLWAWCALLIALAIFGKFYCCHVAARWAGLDPAQACVIGAMMNTRALMELVVINIGFDLGVRVLDAGADGNLQHRDHHPPAQALVACCWSVCSASSAVSRSAANAALH